MYFFKFIILILIITGSTSIGFILSKRYIYRVKELRTFSSYINIIKNKIKFTHKPLNEIFKEISNIKEDLNITSIFVKAGEKLQSKKCEQAWSEAIEEERNSLNLKNEDINLIKSLGIMLGKTDIEGQISELEEFSILLETQIKNASEEQFKNEKMCKSLGLIFGLVIVIILY